MFGQSPRHPSLTYSLFLPSIQNTKQAGQTAQKLKKKKKLKLNEKETGQLRKGLTRLVPVHLLELQNFTIDY